jgi:hypothetical protein
VPGAVMPALQDEWRTEFLHRQNSVPWGPKTKSGLLHIGYGAGREVAEAVAASRACAQTTRRRLTTHTQSQRQPLHHCTKANRNLQRRLTFGTRICTSTAQWWARDDTCATPGSLRYSSPTEGACPGGTQADALLATWHVTLHSCPRQTNQESVCYCLSTDHRRMPRGSLYPLGCLAKDTNVRHNHICSQKACALGVLSGSLRQLQQQQVKSLCCCPPAAAAAAAAAALRPPCRPLRNLQTCT